MGEPESKQQSADWASIAQIVSGIAVVVTLVFLTIGLRDSTNTTRTLVYEQLVGSLNDFNMAILQDEELAELWLGEIGQTVDHLDDLEQAKLSMLYQVVFRSLDAAFYAGRYDTIGLSERERFENAACVVYRRSIENFGTATGLVVSNDFRAFVEAACN